MTPEFKALHEVHAVKPDALKCVNTILRGMKRRSPYANTYDNEPEGDAQKAEGYIRDFGTWVAPEGAEDEEDYDYNVLDARSKDILEEIFEEAELQLHGGFNIYAIQYDEEEKNWLTIRVTTLD